MKLINWIKSNYFNLLLFVILFFMISPVILSKPLNNLDEVWNYNFAQNIADGLVPYRDFNMLQTPLLPFITSFFLLIFGGELIVSRILAIFLMTFIFVMIAKILEKLTVNKYFIFISLFILFFLLKDYICIDYNFAILGITLILIYLSFKTIFFIKENKNYFLLSFLIGILSSFCILLKQSTGILIAFMSIFYPILFVRNMVDFKNYIKNSSIKIIGIFIPLFFLLLYLLLNHALSDFIDYTILGIKTFTNSIPYSTLLHSKNVVLRSLSIFMPIFIVLSGIYLFKKKKDFLFGFYSYCLGSLIVIYPIADAIHFLIGCIPFILLAFYFLYSFLVWLKEKIKWRPKIKLFAYEITKSMIYLSIFCYMLFSAHLLGIHFSNDKQFYPINHYSQIPISEQLLNKILSINEYILKQPENVYILDAEAAIYLLPLNRYYKDFNLFLKGNLGSHGEERSN